MEVEVSKRTSLPSNGVESSSSRERDQLRLQRKTLQAVLDHCQKALQSLHYTHADADADEVQLHDDQHDDELCDLLKSRVESPEFLEKLGSVHASFSQNMSEEGSTWDLVNETDVWDSGNIDEALESDKEGYVLVKQEDIVDGIASFMAAYLLSLKETKELTPNQLQEALSKTFCVKKKKGKLRKAWDGSKVIYNVASWGATAIGIYQNPALIRAASMAFWNSCQVISKLL